MAEREPLDWTKVLQPAIDNARHITTLNAGSIVLIGTFLKDIFPSKDETLAVGPGLKCLIAASFICFGLSLLTATLSMLLYTRALQRVLVEEDSPASDDPPLRYYVRQAPLPLFAVGLVCFGAAVLLNLYR
jgi:hypothetical protein